MQALKGSTGKTNLEKKKMNLQNQYLTPSPSIITKSKLSSLRTPNTEAFKLFDFPFIMIQDPFHNYKPIFKEYPPVASGISYIDTYPMLYLAAAFGFCPFLRQSVRKSSKTAHNTAGNAQGALQSPPLLQKSKYERIKKAGFCECCLEKYTDMDMVMFLLLFLAC